MAGRRLSLSAFSYGDSRGARHRPRPGDGAFGGAKGRSLTLVAGDVVVLPAGTGHRCIRASADFLVVGAYPAGGDYDEPRPDEVDHDKALASIAKVKHPLKDPIYGAEGTVVDLWKKKSRRAPRARRPVTRASS